MSGEEDGGDIAPVVQLVPRAQTAVKGSARYCSHRQIAVNEEDRTVACGTCGKVLDPVGVLLEYARRERNWQSWDQATNAKERELAELKEEEAKVKARLKGARKKDAEHAVALERSRFDNERLTTVLVAREIRKAAERIERTMTRKRKVEPL